MRQPDALSGRAPEVDCAGEEDGSVAGAALLRSLPRCVAPALFGDPLSCGALSSGEASSGLAASAAHLYDPERFDAEAMRAAAGCIPPGGRRRPGGRVSAARALSGVCGAE